MINFTELGLSKPISSVLQESGYKEPTEIQQKAIPVILSGADIMASAQTGSGKTAAYALPIIERLEGSSQKPRILVLVPTRELAVQVQQQFEKFAKKLRLRVVTVYGGTAYDRQFRALRNGADILVATPGRLLDHIERRSADLSMLEVLVLDEADRLMDMGFMPQVRKVITTIPKIRQTLMFSATIDKRVERIAAEYLTKPVVVQANVGQVEPKEIDQRLYYVNEFGKDALLLKLIKEDNMKSVLVFTRTRRKAGWIKNRLQDSSVLAEEIHGDISQNQRERTLAGYRKGNFTVLVATDIAARGLDIPSITHVINYDLPDSPADYVHRIGRTGRSGRSGIALSFVSDEQRGLVRDIERITGRQLDPDSHQHPVQPFRKSKSSRSFRPRRRRAV